MTRAVAKTVKEDHLSVVHCDVTGEVAGSFSTAQVTRYQVSKLMASLHDLTVTEEVPKSHNDT